ncbi:integral membrane protein S linking to the trans Golgi network-domain-containing protein [Polychytrium aggregatum]|uniref:integral membrane protein S linking to the trans Golgi network-domain-containing protein n=1 Tax=Polychytrium aggregatum TaxID=110093 RepID=UPI0022FDEB64|nr:integral membrane protein S linking to the trans Golgi network-domain-containing protein [Polychytrium aggregatum]KAI9203780.1 integral membrane protein S linking to the trans Golgi network-domain-containing protein [Polychytrium aggregatum]
MSNSSYRLSSFDPILIVAQIVTLQCLYYLSLSLIIFVMELLTGSSVTIRHILGSSEIRTDTVLGWAIFFSFLLNSCIGSYSLLVVVQRAKLCLDFASTLHFFHLIICTLYSRQLPNSFLWWINFVLSLVGMSLGGEYLCMQMELRPITLGNPLGALDLTSGPSNAAAAAAASKRTRANDPRADEFELERLHPAMEEP